MSISTKTSFFVCRSCRLEQNLDQSIHVDIPFCVSCYNKEQVWSEIMDYFEIFKHSLKEKGLYTKIRKKKINMLKDLSEMILPLTIFDLSIGEVEDSFREIQRNTFKKAILSLQEDFKFNINENLISHELVQKMRDLFEYTRFPVDIQEELHSHLVPFIDNPIQDKVKFFAEIKKRAKHSTFTKKKGKFQMVKRNPYLFNDEFLFKTVETYVKMIKKATSQPERFTRFVNFLGNDSQFQTMNDLLLGSIIKYAKVNYPVRVEKFNQRVLKEINQEEDSHLIPNIAKYIMDNHEFIFETWFTKILPFDKSRFMVSSAKTGSRTDFIMRIQYMFRSYELKSIEESLRETARLMLEEKAQRKIEKINNNKSFTESEKESKIKREKERLESRLEPKSLKELGDKAAASFQMVARYLLINGEKAFNIILDNVVRYHYKRLRMTTPVSYITNVLESGASEKRKNLKAFYLIQSREW